MTNEKTSFHISLHCIGRKNHPCQVATPVTSIYYVATAKSFINVNKLVVKYGNISVKLSERKMS